jgi:YgiT-type zinc finger domain-containing protein
MKCVICKNGETHYGHVTVTVEREQLIVIIKDVPAEICSNCGEYYLSEPIAKMVLTQGEEAVKKGIEVEIRRFAA